MLNTQSLYDRIIGEHFDITDKETRTVLLNINETDQSQVLMSLTSRLYTSISEKVDDIDFGDIPSTKGDINKVQNMDKLNECLDIMDELVSTLHQKDDPITVVKNAISNIEIRKPLFEKGFRLNLELPMLIYNTMVLSIVSATSYLISTCIEFIKNPGDEGFEVSLNKVALAKTKDHLLYDNLKKFNAACRKGDIDKTLEFVIKREASGFAGSGITVFAATTATVALIMSIIPIMRELIFFFYYSRTRLAQYFDFQATLLQMNANNIEINSTTDAASRDKIVKKQMSIANVFRNMANTIAIKSKTSETKADKEIASSTKKYKIDDVVDERPDSAADSLF